MSEQSGSEGRRYPHILKNTRSNEYIVPTAKRGNVEMGRLVNLDEGVAYGEDPIESVFNWCPHDRWERFSGDTGPIMALLQPKGKPPAS